MLRIDRLLQLGPEPFQGPFFDPGDIAAADAEERRHLPLLPGLLSEEAVAHADHLLFLVRQAAIDRRAELPRVLPGAEGFQQVLIPRHHILQLQGGAIGARLDQLRQRHILGPLPPRPEMHQDLVCYPHPRDFPCPPKVRQKLR